MDGNQRRKLEKEKQRRAKAQALADKQAAVEKSRLEKEARNEALLAERAKVDEARSAAAAERARLEDEKVRAAAKKNAQEKQKATALAEKKKLQQIQNKEQNALAEEAEKKRQRAIASRKADAERKWTANDLAELREEFAKYDYGKTTTIEPDKVTAICAALGEALTKPKLDALTAKMDKGGTGSIAWEDFLDALVPVRESARRSGAGLLEKFGVKKAAAEKKKLERIKNEEQNALAEEAEKKRQRAIASRKADAERKWTANDLAELREEFAKYDYGKTTTIEPDKVTAICAALGEALTKPKLDALTAKMDKGGTGSIAWEDFLDALVPVRESARRSGAGLLEKFGVKKAAAEKKKLERIEEREASTAAAAAEAEKERERATKKATAAKQREKEAIKKRNAEIAARAKEEQKKIELRKQAAEKEKAVLVKKKAAEARKREAEVAKKKAAAVKDKAREREAKKAEAARRKALRKGHLVAQDKMKAKIVEAKDMGNFAVAKKLKADLKQLMVDQEKALKMPAAPKGSKTPRSKNAPPSKGGRVR